MATFLVSYIEVLRQYMAFQGRLSRAMIEAVLRSDDHTLRPGVHAGEKPRDLSMLRACCLDRSMPEGAPARMARCLNRSSLTVSASRSIPIGDRPTGLRRLFDWPHAPSSRPLGRGCPAFRCDAPPGLLLGQALAFSGPPGESGRSVSLALSCGGSAVIASVNASTRHLQGIGAPKSARLVDACLPARHLARDARR